MHTHKHTHVQYTAIQQQVYGYIERFLTEILTYMKTLNKNNMYNISFFVVVYFTLHVLIKYIFFERGRGEGMRVVKFTLNINLS